jgi:hypothetical protein
MNKQPDLRDKPLGIKQKNIGRFSKIVLNALILPGTDYAARYATGIYLRVGLSHFYVPSQIALRLRQQQNDAASAPHYYFENTFPDATIPARNLVLWCLVES